MTAEVVVMNNLGVALAADSAVTVGNKKIFNSANKLFALSKYQPVGFMVYGQAEFMGLPWEVLVKHYRSRLGPKGFDHLYEYANDLFDFIRKNCSALWPPKTQARYVQQILGGYLTNLVHKINELTRMRLQHTSNLSEQDVLEVVKTIIQYEHALWTSQKPLFPDDPEFETELGDHKSLFAETIAATFQKLPIADETMAQLDELCVLVFSKSLFADTFSGVVIAGYGNEELFPTAVSCRVDWALKGVPLCQGMIGHSRV